MATLCTLVGFWELTFKSKKSTINISSRVQFDASCWNKSSPSTLYFKKHHTDKPNTDNSSFLLLIEMLSHLFCSQHFVILLGKVLPRFGYYWLVVVAAD